MEWTETAYNAAGDRDLVKLLEAIGLKGGDAGGGWPNLMNCPECDGYQFDCSTCPGLIRAALPWPSVKLAIALGGV